LAQKTRERLSNVLSGEMISGIFVKRGILKLSLKKLLHQESIFPLE
jgi:hypothetical protein